MNNRYFKAIDVVRLFFAFCIVAIHTFAFEEILSDVNYWYLEKMVFRLGVPFFFIVSGFFIGNKIYCSPNNIKLTISGYVKRLAYPLIVFHFFNMILRGLSELLEGTSILEILVHSIRATIFYPYGSLWYIHASIIAIFLLYYFIKNDKMNIALIIGFILYILGLLANSYYFLIDGTFLAKLVDLYLFIAVSNRNGIFIGFFLLGIGIWISDKKENIYNDKLRKYSLTASFFSFILYFIEVSYVYGRNTKGSGDYFILLPFVTLSIFLFLSTVDIDVSIENSKLCRQLSSGVYFLHSPMISIINIIMLITGNALSPLSLFIVVVSMCLVTLIAVYKTKKEPFYNLLT